MNKKIILIWAISVACIGCSPRPLSQHVTTLKEWHVSPSNDSRSSTIYPFVSWNVVQKIKIGINEADLKPLIHDLQNYHHPINAIVFTKDSNGTRYEVAIKLSKNKIVEDLSFKKDEYNSVCR